MIRRSLYETTIGALLSGQGIASVFREFLQQRYGESFAIFCDGKQLLSRCREQLEEEVDRRAGRQFRLGDIERLVALLWNDDLLGRGRMPVLDQLFQQLMLRNGDFIHYRDTQVDAYARLATEIDPALVVGWHLAGWLDEMPSPRQHDIQRIIGQQTAFFAPPPGGQKSYAEGHVHLGGIAYDGLILAHFLLASDVQDDATTRSFRHMRGVLLALLQRELWTPQEGCGEIEPWQSALSKALTEEPEKTRFDWETLFKLSCYSNLAIRDVPLHELLREMKSASPKLSQAWLWLQVWLWQRFRQSDTVLEVRVAILWLQIELMSLRHRLVMDGQGLTRFARTYFRESLRQKAKKNSNSELLDSITRIMAGQNDLAEIKLGTGGFLPSKIASLARAAITVQRLPLPKSGGAFGIISALPESPQQQAQLDALERWHLCAHFSRAGTPRGSSGKLTTLPQHDAEKCWKEARQLCSDLMTESGWSDPVFLGGMLNQDHCFQPARWLRGLDVAGDENRLGIEWFAPVLRWLRRGLVGRPLSDSAASTSFHLSIHAGEDYAHPLSGLRHVDETVRFCEMREGDRLGHALALGISPAYWAERHGDMLVPVDEHFDNLVWVWHYATELSPCLPLAARILPRLERRIAHFARRVEWLDADTVPDLLLPIGSKRKRKAHTQAEINSPERLFQAWLLRRNCHFQFQKNADTPIYDDIFMAAVPDFAQLQQAQKLVLNGEIDTGDAAGLYLQRQRWQRLNKFDRRIKVLIRYGEEAYERDNRAFVDEQQMQLERDWETAEEHEFMHALQDYLLDRYDRLGLIIETNPTSNVYIARLEQHREHPIFRWNPPDAETLLPGNEHNRHSLRRGPNRVLVNTDDPGIMPTSLRTEYALLREAAIKRGVSRTIAEDWLERLRVYGIEQFHRNHLPVFSRRHY
ncbi:antiviral RADAR system adenosine deaminase RdrB [Zoogloea dura]|nr:antiviral RADAR system adenosine deaminase RdrB [Zoogloea dura]